MKKALLIGALAVAALALSPLAWGRFLDGPWGMIPGGAFRGRDEPCAPEAWQEFATVEELEVEANPGHPRSVTTWSIVHEGNLFLPADFLTPFKRWPHLVMADERIRVRLGGRIFRCRAERVSDRAEIASLRAAASAKYDLDPSGIAARSEVWWFRVAPR